MSISRKTPSSVMNLCFPILIHIFKISYSSIQTMSCKLLLNLVDCIRQRSESEGAAAAGTQPQGRQLLMRILEVFVLKFKTISKLQLPALMNKW